MSKPQTVTNLEESPESERRRRFAIYTISMLIRFACVVLMVFTQGIWQWIFAIGAIFLPYFAVVVGNNSGGQMRSNATSVSTEPLALGGAKTRKDVE